MARAESNGSFYVARGGFQYTGIDGKDDNQICTYNPDNKSVEVTDLDALVGGSCVSQYEENAPSERPRGGELEIGDLWTQKGSRLLHIWDGDGWIRVHTVNGNPVGTIIQNINTTPLAPPPAGYLNCDGTICPSQYSELRDLLFDINGDFVLPSLPAGSYIKF